MSILTASSSQSVLYGFDYYKEGNVLSFEQISDYEYEGYVKGNQKEPYHIILNIKNPRKSYCSCPYACSSNVVCKHMVAMYFAIFKDEAQDYEDWLNSKYSNDECFYDEDDYDDYDRYNRYDDFVLPFCFDELLEEYVNSFSYEELKNKLKNELNINKKETFNNYLKDRYQKYIKQNGNDHAYFDNLNKKINKYNKIYDYDYCDYNQIIISNYDKSKLKEKYKNEKNKSLIDDIILKPKLAVYKDYLWVIKFYKNKLNKDKKNIFSSELNDFFNSLKHYSIKNTIPKSNVLICLYELNDYSIEDSAKSILNNSKYEDYVQYVIRNSCDADKLYNCVINEIEKYKGFDKSNIPNLLLCFHDRFNSNISKMNQILIDESYYDFLFNNHKEALRYLLYYAPEYIEKIEKNIKDLKHLLLLYSETKQIDKLYEIIQKEDKVYLYNEYLDDLKTDYNNELFDYYRNIVFSLLAKSNTREDYNEVASYFRYVNKLNNGKELVNKLINEIKESKYQNRPALFSEINKEIKIINGIKENRF